MTTKYYVICPGRTTSPENYSFSGSIFDGSDQRVFMLATTLENAKAGNYIYSPETDSIDADVVIEVNKYILDANYDLYKYQQCCYLHYHDTLYMDNLFHIWI